MSLRKLGSLLALAVTIAGCPAADSARNDAPPRPVASSGHESGASERAAQASPPMIPIAQAPSVFSFDPQRHARAFENGPVGQPSVPVDSSHGSAPSDPRGVIARAGTAAP